MKTIKPYKATFTRVGTNEQWSGWQLAGITADAPIRAQNEVVKLQNKNSDCAKDFLLEESARTIYEWFCKGDQLSGSFVHFSKLQFGITDDTLGHRASMRSDSVLMPLSNESNILYSPYNLLQIYQTCFENQLEIDKKRYPDGRLKVEELSTSDAQTIYPEEVFEIKENFYYQEWIKKAFRSHEDYLNMIRCVYWALTFKSTSTLNIVYNGTVEDYFKLFALIMESLIYSFRPCLSFRTRSMPANTAAVQSTIVFTKYVPQYEKYFNVSTGENNILKDKVVEKLSKYSTLQYFIEQNKVLDYTAFFDDVEKAMVAFGDKDSTEMKFIDTAFLLFAEGQSDMSTLEDTEIRKKLIRYLKLPYSNDNLDSAIASVLDEAMSRDMNLNEDIQRYLMNKLKSTKSDELSQSGYKYQSYLLIKKSDSEPEKAYSDLMEAHKDKDSFKKLKDNLLSLGGGAHLLDSFYGAFYGPDKVHDIRELEEFRVETCHLPERDEINLFIEQRCRDIGNEIVTDSSDDTVLIKRFNEYCAFIQRVYGDSALNNHIINSAKRKYWDDLNFSNFDIEHEELYQLMSITGTSLRHEKCKLCLDLLKAFSNVKKMTVSGVGAIRNLVLNSDLDSQQKKMILLKYREYAYSKCDLDYGIDYWIEMSQIIMKLNFNFIHEKKIQVFYNPYTFEREVKRSDSFKSIDFVEIFLSDLEKRKTSESKRDFLELYDNVRKIRKELLSTKNRSSRNNGSSQRGSRYAERHSSNAQSSDKTADSGRRQNEKKKDDGRPKKESSFSLRNFLHGNKDKKKG